MKLGKWAEKKRKNYIKRVKVYKECYIECGYKIKKTPIFPSKSKKKEWDQKQLVKRKIKVLLYEISVGECLLVISVFVVLFSVCVSSLVCLGRS